MPPGPAGAGRFEDLDDARVVSRVRPGDAVGGSCLRAALAAAAGRGVGAGVNVTAMSVQHQSPGLVGYTAAKSALLSVTKNLPRSLAPMASWSTRWPRVRY